MASIKVTFGQTSRKFTIESNTTWKEFEIKLRDLLNIPKETSISISYVDEDSDIITLSTDSELQQILSDQESFGGNVKFNIYTSDEGSDNNGWVLENAEEKDDDSVATISDDETNPNKGEGIVAYTIGEPKEPENTENVVNTENTENEENTENVENIENVENTEIDVHTEQQQQQSSFVEVHHYPSVTVTDEKDDPLFEPTIQKEDSEFNSDALLTLVDSINQEKEQRKESPAESSKNVTVENSSNNIPVRKSSSSSSSQKKTNDEKINENNEESDDDSNVIFVFSSRPWTQRTYYRPRFGLFNSLLNNNNNYHYPTHYNHFFRPSRVRYSYITPSYSFRRNPYHGSRCGLTSRGFGGSGSGFGNSLYNFGF